MQCPLYAECGPGLPDTGLTFFWRGEGEGAGAGAGAEAEAEAGAGAGAGGPLRAAAAVIQVLGSIVIWLQGGWGDRKKREQTEQLMTDLAKVPMQ